MIPIIGHEINTVEEKLVIIIPENTMIRNNVGDKIQFHT